MRCSRSCKNLKAKTAVAIGYIEPKTIATDTDPLLQAIPKSRLARKSATPIKSRLGNSCRVNPPKLRARNAIAIVTMKVAARIVTIVIKALDCDPIEINVRAVPKPAAAPTAKSSGRNGTPFVSSGPLAQNAPASATTTPHEVRKERASPLNKA